MDFLSMNLFENASYFENLWGNGTILGQYMSNEVEFEWQQFNNFNIYIWIKPSLKEIKYHKIRIKEIQEGARSPLSWSS